MSFPKFKTNFHTWETDNFSGGLCLCNHPRELRNNQSPDMLNMLHNGKVLKKREGQKILFDNGGNDDIHSVYEEDFCGYLCYHIGTKIKAFKDGEQTVLYENLTEQPGVFFGFNGYLYYLGGGDYIKITLTGEGELSAQTVAGTVPWVIMNAGADGCGDDNEPYNYLTSGFKVSYSFYEETTSLVIPNAPLNPLKGVKILYNNYALSANRFTVNYETGEVTFTGISVVGINTLEITAYQSDSSTAEDRQRILGCNLACVYGGLVSGLNEGTRVFIAGDPENPSAFYKSALLNPEYFPVDGYETVGDASDPITAFGKQYDYLIVLKKKSIHEVCYQISGAEVFFTISELNSSVGCDVPNTTRIIDNRLVWLNSIFGLCTLKSTEIKSEKNVLVLSENINGRNSKYGLLNQDFTGAYAFVSNNRYYIVTKKYTYVLNFALTPFWDMYEYQDPKKLSFFLLDNITAKGAAVIGGICYLAGEKERFTYFDDCLYDFTPQIPIKAYVTTKINDFGEPFMQKLIHSVYLNIRSEQNTHFTISYSDQEGELKERHSYIVKKFSFADFSFDKFTFFSKKFEISIGRNLLRKGVLVFQIKLENNEENSDMAVSNISIQFERGRKIKYDGI